MSTLTLETVVSDRHELIGTMLTASVICKPKKLFYRCYKNFSHEKFEEELKKHLSSVLDFELFHLVFKTNLDQFAYLKQNVE